MKKLTEINKSLEKLHKDFNKQLNELGNNSHEFHNALISLSTKYPEHKELLEFIVYINDKLETNQTLFTEIVTESFNDLVNVKKTLIEEIINSKEQIKKSGCLRQENKIESFFKNLNITDIKSLGYIIITILALALALIDGGLFTNVFTNIIGFLHV
jgi:HD superfamily phosphohydrolase YqeK